MATIGDNGSLSALDNKESDESDDNGGVFVVNEIGDEGVIFVFVKLSSAIDRLLSS